MTAYDKFLKEAESEYIDHERFSRVKNLITEEMDLRRKSNPYEAGGVGTLSEKSVHAILKNYIEPDRDCHEVALDGFFADVFKNGEVTEIQTAQFGKLRDKLSVFLNNYNVTVVYPMAVNKWISRIDKTKRSAFRMSPLHMNEYFAFDELYAIKSFLTHPNLRVHLYMMDIEEIKIKVEKRRKRRGSGYERYDRIPIGLRKIVEFNCVNDYLQVVPPDLNEEFISSEFAQAAGISRSHASLVLNVLNETGVVIRTGKRGNSYLYKTAY